MSAERKTEAIPEWKQEEVAALVDVLESYESVGVVDVRGIPSRQLQEMRAELYGTAQLRMGRNTLIRRALDDVDEGAEDLAEYVSGQVGLIGTDDNPFALFKQLEASKTSAPIQAGEVAPDEIVVPEGDTGIDDLQMVGDFNQAGVNARPGEDGTIEVMEDSVVAEAGEEIDVETAGVLDAMGIEPKEVGLDLRAAFSDGVVFEADELAVDEDAYYSDVQTAAARARNLALNAEFPTSQTTPALLAKASGEAKALALHAAIEDPDVMPDLVARADAQMKTLAAAIDDDEALPEELRDVEAPEPAAAEAEPEDDDDEQPDDQPEAEPDDDGGDGDGDDDDDGDAGAEGLGEMFG
jgi:large subunit ribosomal protein L10